MPETLGKKMTPVLTERTVVLMSKDEKAKLQEACAALGKKLNSKISMGELIRHATFEIGIPHLLKKAKTPSS